jgi:mannan endo-1,4-beta-mannosidase
MESLERSDGQEAYRTGGVMDYQGKSVILLLLFLGISAFVLPDRSKEKSFLQEDILSFPPVNLQATQETKELLYLLYYLKGQYTLAGQHNYLEEPELYTNMVTDEIDQTPALHGYELGAILGQSSKDIRKQRQKVVDSAIRTDQAGGIVTITYHAHLPGECACWEQVNNGGISQAEFKKIITPGTDLNKQLLADLDEVAGYLKKLQDAKVPVLWRPYHEMNGGWFWWGKQAEYAQLWEIMYERFTKVHKLNNLLWVWSPSAPNDYADPFEPYYVGPLRADILAVDVYHGEYEQSYHDQLWVLSGGKPIAIGENGELPTSKLLNVKQRQYIWFMTWAAELEEKNGFKDVKELYGSNKVLTIEKMKALEQAIQ